MPTQKLKQYLDEQNVKYVSIAHSLAFTSLQIAKSADIPTKQMAKTVILKINNQLAMLIIPSAYQVNLEIISQALVGSKVELATESEFSSKFPDCEVGAMPPFGNLYGMDVYIAESVSEHDEIVFNAGTHSEVIKMAYKEYERLVKPTLIVLDQ